MPKDNIKDIYEYLKAHKDKAFVNEQDLRESIKQDPEAVYDYFKENQEDMFEDINDFYATAGIKKKEDSEPSSTQPITQQEQNGVTPPVSQPTSQESKKSTDEPIDWKSLFKEGAAPVEEENKTPISTNEIIQDMIKSGEITYTDENGDPCAANGLTDTTTGTGWKIVKNFYGMPKHSSGGVDITISDKGVTMRRGGKEIKAAHGLLIINE